MYPQTISGSEKLKRPQPKALLIFLIIFLAWRGAAAAHMGDYNKSSFAKRFLSALVFQGPPGPAGKDGINGINGTDGANGTDGVDGVNGVDGANGTAGVDGAQGPKGDSGDAGCISGACVSLQSSTPGTQETGNININGAMIAATFDGDGSALTNLNASNIGLGTLDDNRLSGNVALLNVTNVFTAKQSIIQGSTSTVGLGFKVAGDSNDRFTISQDGSLSWGDGTTTPDLVLQRQQAGKLIITQQVTGGGAGIVLQSVDPNSSAVIMRRSSGTISSPSSVVAGSTIGQINFDGYDGSAWQTGGQILAQAEDTWSTSNRATVLKFSNRNGTGGGFSERMRISPGGTVQIGSTAAQASIGTAEKLRVNTPSTIDNSAVTILATGGSSNKGLVIQGSSSQSANLQEWQVSTGAVRTFIDSNGNLGVKAATAGGNLTVNGHYISGNASGTTTITAGTAAGTSPTVSISGNDTSGTITITTGASGVGTGILGTITFANAYSATPRVVFTPKTAAGAALQLYNTTSTTSFTINTGTAPATSTTYTFDYHVMQ